MNDLAASQSTDTSNDPRKMGKLARSYARNRSLFMVVFLVIFLILYAALGGSSYFGAMAYRYGQWGLLCVCIVILIVGLAGTVYLSVPRWGGKLIERITKRLYAGEGNAQLSNLMSGGRKLVGWCMAATFLFCILASVVLGFLGVLPQKYMQPVSAIYVVPFVVGIWLLQRPALGPIILLWPALYAIHAILIIAGVSILFVGRWDSLNMLIPTFGYGFIASLIAHIYSRIQLRRLRCMTRGHLSDEAFEETRP
jgi:hypothetical protein